MPIGIIINALSIVIGGILGAFVGHKLSPKFKEDITLVFGVCSMGMGISTIAGIMSAVGKFFSFTIRKPVASIRNPPQALKSLIMPGVVSGKIAVAARTGSGK